MIAGKREHTWPCGCAILPSPQLCLICHDIVVPAQHSDGTREYTVDVLMLIGLQCLQICQREA